MLRIIILYIIIYYSYITVKLFIIKVVEMNHLIFMIISRFSSAFRDNYSELIAPMSCTFYALIFVIGMHVNISLAQIARIFT